MRKKSDALYHLEQGLTNSTYEKMKMRITHVTIKWYDTFYLYIESTIGARMVDVFTSPYSNQTTDQTVHYKKNDDVKLWDPKYKANDWVPNSAFSITCHKCMGDGEEICKTCSGKGIVRCNICFGTGKVDCSYCHGSGYLETGKKDELCMRCTDGTMNCVSCSGQGEIKCDVCGGDKTFVCDGCKGQRRLYQRLYLRQTEKLAEEILIIKPMDILENFRSYNFRYDENSHKNLRQRLVEISYTGYLEHSEVMLAAKKAYGPAYHQMEKVDAFLNDASKHALDERMLKQDVEVFIGQTAVISYRYNDKPHTLLYDDLNACYHQEVSPVEESQPLQKAFLKKHLLWFVLGVLVGILISFLRRL